MTGQNELIKISTLQDRYKLNSRQAVSNRINGLKIQPVARGQISLEQLELLDRLDKHIRGGGAITDFPIQPEVQVDKLDKLNVEPDTNEAMSTTDYLPAINVMAQLIERMMSYTYAPQQRSPLAIYEDLEKIVQFEWILPTSKIKELTGITPKTSKGEEVFIFGSFAFIRTDKIGRETGWKVVHIEFVEQQQLLQSFAKRREPKN
ncbi:MAG TPA: hypothetical protein VE944_30540 [Nostoc sp.]|uniref:hypothetical protein n=1 Tax=Nostoc sp. TaxID=1180 RepID=UPI002D4A2F84|nr:hypothetical protein [Nostoc sp.]HYX18629.1 hypothetical protein [Nostoc sp.]